MVSLGFLNENCAPTTEAKNVHPSDIHGLPPERAEKTVVLFHDESTFQSNEDQPTLWAEKGTTVMRPTPKGCGIIVSDFIDKRNGFLHLMDEDVYHPEKKQISDKNQKSYGLSCSSKSSDEGDQLDFSFGYSKLSHTKHRNPVMAKQKIQSALLAARNHKLHSWFVLVLLMLFSHPL